MRSFSPRAVVRALVFTLLGFVPLPSAAATPAAPVPAGAQFDASGSLDPEIATQAHLNTLSAEMRHDSHKYFEGDYWYLHEADMFGLNATRQPDGFAQSMVKFSTNRKVSPTPLEEVLFYDHPSGHTRILDAMQWKSQNQGVQGYK